MSTATHKVLKATWMHRPSRHIFYKGDVIRLEDNAETARLEREGIVKKLNTDERRTAGEPKNSVQAEHYDDAEREAEEKAEAERAKQVESAQGEDKKSDSQDDKSSEADKKPARGRQAQK